MTRTNSDFDFYSHCTDSYLKCTFFIDPTPFLEPLTRFVKPPAKILDVGCASGRDLLWFKNRGYPALGLERSAALAEMARKNAGCRVIEADFQSFDFTTLKVDAVILVGALVHLIKPDFANVLMRISQSVKEHGFMLISVKEGTRCQAREDGRTFRLWNDGEIRPVFVSLGLEVVYALRSSSQLGTGESWLAYVLKKP